MMSDRNYNNNSKCAAAKSSWSHIKSKLIWESCRTITYSLQDINKSIKFINKNRFFSRERLWCCTYSESRSWETESTYITQFICQFAYKSETYNNFFILCEKIFNDVKKIRFFLGDCKIIKLVINFFNSLSRWKRA